MIAYSKVTNDTALSQLLAEAVKAVHASEASILLFNPDGASLRFVLSHSPVAEKLLGSTVSLQESITGLAAVLQQPMLVNEVKEDPKFQHDVDLKSGVVTKSILVMPLVTPQQQFGALTAINSEVEGGFGREDMETYAQFAERICRRLAELDLGMEHVGAIE